MQYLRKSDAIALYSIIPPDIFVKMMLPVKHFFESICFISVSASVSKVKVWLSPLYDLRITLVSCDKAFDFFTKLWDTKICISTENLGKGSFVIWAFVVDWVESQIQKFIKKSFVHIGDLLLEGQNIISSIILDVSLLLLIETHMD